MIYDLISFRLKQTFDFHGRRFLLRQREKRNLISRLFKLFKFFNFPIKFITRAVKRNARTAIAFVSPSRRSAALIGEHFNSEADLSLICDRLHSAKGRTVYRIGT